MNEITYQWQSTDRRQRLDKVLAQGCSLSRTQLQRWIENGLVTSNGQTLDAKYTPKAGEILKIQIPPIVPLELEPCERPLDILYEDKEMLVLNKATGDIVHPGAGNRHDTLVSALLYHCKGKLSGIGGVERPGIVHRLDKETSGVLVIAKTDTAHQALSKQFQERTIDKIYLAYVLGKMRSMQGSWNWAIGRHPTHRQKMHASASKGRSALTEFQVVQAFKHATLLEIKLHTGRTHQIRVHAAKAGYPVIGDTTYGRPMPWLKQAGITRQLLHAYKISFLHPTSNKPVEFRAPLPQDFKNFESFLHESETSSNHAQIH